MSPTLVIVLIVVVWLFVLAPWLLRGQRPISKAGEAFDDTRVVYSGGSGELPARKRPKLTPQDVHAGRSDESLELVNAEPVEDEALIDDESARRVDHAMESVKSKLSKKTHDAPATEVEADVVDGEVVTVLPEPEVAEETPEVIDISDEDEPYQIDDAYVAPGDLLYPGEEDPVVESAPEAELSDDEPETTSDDELTDEDLEFAARRAHRGGWDPEADAQASTDRYQRRTRTLIGLAVAAVLTLIVGFVVGGWAWIMPAIVVAFAAVYMVALRQQVQAEERLRARRIAQLRRARLGVKNENDELLGIPQRLRRPGAVVLELDDESPDFEDLEMVAAPESNDPRTDITADSRRRVG